MKNRMILAMLLLMALGPVRAQEPKVQISQNADTIIIIKPDKAEFEKLMRQYNDNLQRVYDSIDWKRLAEEMTRTFEGYLHEYDSVDWKSIEKQMKRAEKEMEEWGRKMERWGEEFEKKNDKSYNQRPLENDEPQVRAIQVEGSGDVKITQNPDLFSLVRVDQRNAYYEVVNNTLVLRGSSDYEVAMPQLDEVLLRSSGDVQGKGIIKGGNLKIFVAGSGDLWMNVDYDTINIQMRGSGDVTLHGQCKVLYAEMSGSGDLKVQQLNFAESYINATGSGSAWTSKSGNVLSYKHRKSYNKTYNNLLFDAHWNGFEAGLNMLFNPEISIYTMNGTSQNAYLGIKPLRSWYFGFNIADVGVAFNKRHTAGIFTGVGIGWNNFSWKNPVVTTEDPETGIVTNTLLPLEEGDQIKKSKLGLLYLQVPIMVEIRPTRRMYVDLGVTGGLRFAAWSKVKYMDGRKYSANLDWQGAFLNRFKLDASLRVGGDYVGLFINYALIPVYRDEVVSNTHPLSFGFSLTF